MAGVAVIAGMAVIAGRYHGARSYTGVIDSSGLEQHPTNIKISALS